MHWQFPRVTSPKRFVQHFWLSGVVSALVCALAAGCSVEDNGSINNEFVAQPTEDRLIADSMYMAQIFADKGDSVPFIRLDLSDDRQFQYVQNRLAYRGKNPQNSPYLFDRLDETRKRHQLARDKGESITKAAGGGPLGCGVFPFLGGEVQGPNFVVTGQTQITCRGNLDYMWSDLQLYETDEDETYLSMLSNGWAEDFGVFELFTNEIQGSVVIDGNKLVKVNGFSMGSDFATGVDEFLFTDTKSVADQFATITTYNPPAIGTTDGCNVDHPRDVTGDGIVRLCYQRSKTAGIGDCDYAAVNAAGVPGKKPLTHIAMMEQAPDGSWVASDQRWAIPGAPVNTVTNLLVPLQGAVDSGMSTTSGQECKIMSFKPDETDVSITLNATGGWCNGEPSASGGPVFYENQQTNLQILRQQLGAGNVFEVPFGVDLSQDPEQFNTMLLDFGDDCLGNLQDVSMLINSCFVSPGSGCWDDNNPKTRCASCSMIFDVRNSCFAAGTEIRLADGRMIPVEQVAVGDRVVSDGDNRLLTVTGLTQGGEDEPMVRVRDSLGHELMLTAKHPVYTSQGLMPADSLVPKMHVETEAGLATIVQVERVPYDGMVYNLTLGTEDELAMVAADDVTMFAGGIRVGDNEVQLELERRSTIESGQRRDAASVWERDQAFAEVRNAVRSKLRALQHSAAGLLDS